MSDMNAISSATAFQVSVLANAAPEKSESAPQEAQEPAKPPEKTKEPEPPKESPSVYNTVQSASNSTVDGAGVNVVV